MNNKYKGPFPGNSSNKFDNVKKSGKVNSGNKTVLRNNTKNK